MEKNKTDLQQLFAEYINECLYSSRLSTETIRSYKAVFKLFCLIMPEITSPSFLSTELLIEFFKRLQNRDRKVGNSEYRRGVKDSTIKTYWSKLHSFFYWLQSNSVIKKNPLDSIKPPKPYYDDEKSIKEIEIRKLYASIILYSYNPFNLRRDTVMISLLLFCGIRLGEFIDLEVRDLDLEKQLITIRGNTSKSKRIRHIPIHPTLLLHLKEYISARNKKGYKSHYLITSSHKDSQLSRHGLKHWTHTLHRKSGVKFHLHQFRHSFACNLARNNVHPIKIQRLLGHSSLLMTMTYLRSIDSEEMKEDINKLSI